MRKIAVAEARRRFKEVLSNPGADGTAIERHGKPVAFVVRADQLQRVEAQLRQSAIEDRRLIKHLRIGTRLLASPPHEAQAMIDRALNRVAQWEREGLCSRDYIERWRAMLAKPLAELVDAMCGEAEGWGAALRQNSPW